MIEACVLLTLVVGASVLLGWFGRVSKRWRTPLLFGFLILAGSVGLFSVMMEENSGIGYLRTERFLKTNTLYMTSFMSQSHERFIAELYDEDGGVFFYTLSFQPPFMFIIIKNGDIRTIQEIRPPYTDEQMEMLRRFRKNNFPPQPEKKSQAQVRDFFI